MVNRAAVILVGGIVLVAVAVVGGVAAFVLGGGGGDAGAGTPTFQESTPLANTPTATPGPATDASTPSGSAPTPTATVTGTAGATATATPVPRTTILPRRFDERRIEALVAKYVNDRREDAGLERLRRNGSTAERVRTMARAHSERMADEGEATHVIGGNTSTDRYRDHELYRTCSWRSGLRDSIVEADNNGPQATENALETVWRTFAGREYGDGQFNGDEEAVARTVVEAWWADDAFETRLTLPNAGSIGVGIEITQTGEVYATANLCN